MTANDWLFRTQKVIPRHETLYIATDETNMTYFTPFFQYYKSIQFLHNVLDEEMDAEKLGMMEQFICANARVFIGTQYSTFSSYINRLRGYYDVQKGNQSYIVSPLHANPINVV